MRLEREMIAPIKACLGAHWEDGLVCEEFGVGYGIADVIVARPSHGAIRHRRRLGQTLSFPRRAEVQVIRSLLGMRSATFDNLLDLTGISPSRLRYDVLPFLLAANYIEKISGDTFQLRATYRPVIRELWAVEAKMKNWFEGLCQARRYQHFAHRVYLAIFAPYRDRVRDEVMREQNVGLISVTIGHAEILFHPQHQKPRSPEMFLLTNERIWEQLHAMS